MCSGMLSYAQVWAVMLSYASAVLPAHLIRFHSNKFIFHYIIQITSPQTSPNAPPERATKVSGSQDNVETRPNQCRSSMGSRRTHQVQQATTARKGRAVKVLHVTTSNGKKGRVYAPSLSRGADCGSIVPIALVVDRWRRSIWFSSGFGTRWNTTGACVFVLDGDEGKIEASGTWEKGIREEA
ncbi:hypothetical protein C8R45DRAFT_1044683 [Mycena sanguinolenta]|nr:hypothetical protein C8R45DRAFT_1044683 [Mycena sanguinolenta]